jgi:hypothetical protein
MLSNAREGVAARRARETDTSMLVKHQMAGMADNETIELCGVQCFITLGSRKAKNE